MRALVGAGADKSAQTSSGATALELAQQEGHQDVADFLVGGRAPAQARSKQCKGKKGKKTRKR